MLDRLSWVQADQILTGRGLMVHHNNNPLSSTIHRNNRLLHIITINSHISKEGYLLVAPTILCPPLVRVPIDRCRLIWVRPRPILAIHQVIP